MKVSSVLELNGIETLQTRTCRKLSGSISKLSKPSHKPIVRDDCRRTVNTNPYAPSPADWRLKQTGQDLVSFPSIGLLLRLRPKGIRNKNNPLPFTTFSPHRTSPKDRETAKDYE